MKLMTLSTLLKSLLSIIWVISIGGCSYNKTSQKVIETNYTTNKQDRASKFYISQETNIDHGVISVKPIITGVFPRYKVEKVEKIQTIKNVSSSKMISTLSYAALSNGLSLLVWNNKCGEHQVTCTEKSLGTNTREVKYGKARKIISTLPNEVTVTFKTDNGLVLTIPANKDGIVTTNLRELKFPAEFDVVVSYKNKSYEETFDMGVQSRDNTNIVTLSNSVMEIDDIRRKTTSPFKKVNQQVNEYMSAYMSSVSMPYLPEAPMLPKVKEPSLPPAPTLIKSQFETKAEFQQRVQKALNAREDIIAKIQTKYKNDVNTRNKRLKKMMNTHNEYLLKISSQYKNRIAKLKSTLKDEQRTQLKLAITEVLGYPELENLQYDAEKQIAHAELAMHRAEFRQGIQWSVAAQKAKELFTNPNLANIEVDFLLDEQQNSSNKSKPSANRIVLNKVRISTKPGFIKSQNFDVALNNKNYNVDDVRVVLSDQSPNWKNAAEDSEKMAIVNIAQQMQSNEIIDIHNVSAITYVNNMETSIGTKAFNDDIPTLLAKAKATEIKSNRWLVVIGIENYQFTDKVSFAKRSAELFVQVVQKKLGVKPSNTLALIDEQATAGALKDTLRLFLANIPKNDEILFYYSGHGISNPQEQNEPYILPIDKIPGFVAEDKSLQLASLYQQLSNSRAKNIIAFIDSCFSGATDGKSILSGVAAARLVPKTIDFNQRKMTILTAGRYNQFSNAFKEKGNRLFSYFLMKAMLEDRKDISTLYQRVAVNVKDQSKKLGLLYKQEPLLKGYKKYSL